MVREQWQWGVRFVASPPLADVVAATSHRTGRPAQAHHPAAVGLRRGAGDHRTVDVRTAVSTFLFPWSMQELGSGTTMLIAAGLCALGGCRVAGARAGNGRADAERDRRCGEPVAALLARRWPEARPGHLRASSSFR